MTQSFCLVVICGNDFKQTQQTVLSIKINALKSYSKIILIAPEKNRNRVRSLAIKNDFKYLELPVKHHTKTKTRSLLNQVLHYIFIGTTNTITGCLFITDDYIFTSYKSGYIWEKNLAKRQIINFLEPLHVKEYAKYTDSYCFYVPFLTSPVLGISKKAFTELGYFVSGFDDPYTLFLEYSLRGALKGMGSSIGKYSAMKGYVRYNNPVNPGYNDLTPAYAKVRYNESVENISIALAQ